MRQSQCYLFSVYIRIGFLNFNYIHVCCWYTLELPPPFTINFFHKLLNYFLMFQRNEHEKNEQVFV